MTEEIDARGLSCPEPVVLARKKMTEAGKGSFKVRVDTATARDNIVRLAAAKGWNAEATEESGEYVILISK